MKQIDAKQLLLEHGRFIALGVSLLIVFAVILTSKDKKLAVEINDAAKVYRNFKQQMDSPAPEETALPNYIGNLRSNWEREVRGGEGIHSKYFYREVNITFDKEKPPTKLWINVPASIDISIDREKITVNWTAWEALQPDKNGERAMTELGGYFLFKKWKDTSNREEIYELPEDRTTFEDKNVETSIDYFYTVRAYTTNKDAQGGERVSWRKQNLTLSESRKNDLEEKKIDVEKWLSELVVSKPIKEVKGSILPLYQIKLLGVMGDKALIELSKWHKTGWKKATRSFAKNDRLMIADFKVDGVPFKLDPGWTLVSLQHNALKKEKITKRVPAKDETGRVKMEDGRIVYEDKTETISKRVAMIEYKDNKGQTYKLYR